MYDVKDETEAYAYFVKAKKALLNQKESIEYVEYTNLLSDITRELGE